MFVHMYVCLLTLFICFCINGKSNKLLERSSISILLALCSHTQTHARTHNINNTYTHTRTNVKCVCVFARENYC